MVLMGAETVFDVRNGSRLYAFLREIQAIYLDKILAVHIMLFLRQQHHPKSEGRAHITNNINADHRFCC